MQTCVSVFAFVFVALEDISRTSGKRGETDFCLVWETNQWTTKGKVLVGDMMGGSSTELGWGWGSQGYFMTPRLSFWATLCFFCHSLSKFGRMFCGTMDRVLSQGGSDLTLGKSLCPLGPHSICKMGGWQGFSVSSHPALGPWSNQ